MPEREDVENQEVAQSGIVVFARITAPASRSLVTRVASRGGM